MKGRKLPFSILVLILIISTTVFANPSYAASTTATETGATFAAISPDADSYVVADVASQTDQLGLRTINYGASLTLDVGFQTSVGQTIVTVAYLRFPLTNGAQILSARLQLYVNGTYSSQRETPIKVVAVAVNGSTKWDEMKIDYNNAPRLLFPLSTAPVTRNQTYYSWDVTNATKKLTYPAELTLAVQVNVIPKQEQHVVFNSRESSLNTPRLVVTYAAQPNVLMSLVGPWAAVAVVLVVAVVAAGLYQWRRVRRA